MRQAPFAESGFARFHRATRKEKFLAQMKAHIGVDSRTQPCSTAGRPAIVLVTRSERIPRAPVSALRAPHPEPTDRYCVPEPDYVSIGVLALNSETSIFAAFAAT